MRLHHLHLRKPISYAYSLRLQEALLEQHFAYKTALRTDSTSVISTPSPTLITFQSNPTYTVGRRHFKDNPLSPFQINFLTGSTGGLSDDDSSSGATESPRLATFYPSPRGGLLTYHAPGQLTAYLVLNLRTHALTPRCYIRLLENVVMRTCAKHGVPNVTTTTDPGVWIQEERADPTTIVDSKKPAQKPEQEPEQRQDISEETASSTGVNITNRKICAVGVHVSRGVTSHGIGLNIFDCPIDSKRIQQLYTLSKQSDSEVTVPAPGFLSWGFSRIVACGLEGKSVTWLTREWKEENMPKDFSQTEISDAISDPSTQMNLMHSIAGTIASETAEALQIGASNIDTIFEHDILSPDESVNIEQRKRDWNFLKGLPGNVEDDRPELDKKTYRTGSLREDPGLRFL